MIFVLLLEEQHKGLVILSRKDCRTTIPPPSIKFQVCVPFIVAFIDLQILEIRCVNYTPFPKSSHLSVQNHYSC